MGEKKVNKWVFMLIATIFNIVLVLAIFLVFMVIMSLLARVITIPDSVIMFLPFIAIIGSFVLSFVIYSKVMKWAMKKWNIEGTR